MKVFKAFAASLSALSILVSISEVDAAPKKRIEGFGVDTVDTSRRISAEGEGCPRSSVTAIVNGSDVAVIFTKFGTTAAPGSAKAVRCNITVPLNIPPGYTAEPAAVAYQGSVALVERGSAVVRTTLSWGGRSRTYDNLELEKVYGPSHAGGWHRNLEARVGGGVKACKGKVVSDFSIDTKLIADARRVKGDTAVSLDLSTTDIGFGSVLYRVQFDFTPCS